jgi:ankyrin repeat protein
MVSQEQIDDLMMDARAGDLEALKEFLGALGSKEEVLEVLPQIKDEYSLSTALHYASANGHLDVVEYIIGLCDQRTDVLKELVSAKNESGNIALHWAALNGHLEVIKLLCDAGADPFLQNEAGHDAIYEAQAFEKEDVVDYLLERFNIEPVDDDNDDDQQQQDQVTDQVADINLKSN